MKKKKVFIAIPIFRDIKTITFNNIIDTKANSQHEIAYYQHAGDGLISRVRNELGRKFLVDYKEYDYLMFIDDDITWDAKTKPIDKLISRNKDIICGIYPVRNGTCRPAIRTKEVQKLLEAGKPIDKKTKIPKRPFLIHYAATGFLLISRKCLEDIYSKCKYPFTPAADDYEYLSEDYAFCWRLLQLKYQIWADPTIKLGHIGECIYTLDGVKSLN